jgi:hypothetical protein
MKTSCREMKVGCFLLILSIAISLFALHTQGFSAGGDKKDAKKGNKDEPAWKSLFDGKSMAGWKDAKFGGEGEVAVVGGAIVMEQGNDMTGIAYAKNDFPKMNYEVALEGKRVRGFDFFCTTTFPVGESHCSLVMGGWGGGVVGLSSIDGHDASENATSTQQDFKKDQWYRVRIRVTKNNIAAWIDDKQVVDEDIKDKKISIRAECELCKPFGFATWRTIGAVRDIKVRTLSAEEAKK